MEKPHNVKKKLYDLAIGVLLIVFLVSSGLYIKQLYEDHVHAKDFAELSSMVSAETVPVITTSQESEEGKTEAEKADELRRQQEEARKALATQKLEAYQSLHEENPDMIGWVKIDGTKIDYPVMQTPEDPEYYLHVDFNGKKSNSGTPFMDASCIWQKPATNLLIYGHHMKNGEMFADLMKYSDPEFAKSHSYITFDTLEDLGTYEVLLAFRLDASDSSKPWEELIFPKNEDGFMTAWNYANENADYQSGITPKADDHLLALVTCEYTQKDGRLMVIAKEVDE